MRTLIIIFSLIMLSGCASMFTGNEQSIDIRTDKDTEIFVNDRFAGVGIARIKLPTDEQHNIRVSKPGCYDRQMLTQPRFNKVSLLGIGIDFGLISIPIDFATGAAWKIYPQEIKMTADCEGSTGS